MTLEPEVLDLDSFGQVIGLYKPSKQTLGFLPNGALEDYFKKGGAIGIKNEDGQLLGYTLVAVYSNYVRICQICVDENARGLGVAQKLVDYLKLKYRDCTGSA